MRVLSGTARGVPLKTVPDMNTRPILDRIKKSLFSILDSMSLLLDARVADLYSGAGTQGIEALSRGAESCLFVEKRADAVILLKENLAKTRLAEKADARCGEVSTVLRERLQKNNPDLRFDLILYDPPFVFSHDDASRKACEAEMALAGKLLYPGHGRLVLRFEKKAEPPTPEGLSMVRHWTDGPHAFAFYALAATEAEQPLKNEN
jgi:16S rRNA (guanine966-N2)-methyltransferase